MYIGDGGLVVLIVAWMLVNTNEACLLGYLVWGRGGVPPPVTLVTSRHSTTHHDKLAISGPKAHVGTVCHSAGSVVCVKVLFSFYLEFWVILFFLLFLGYISGLGCVVWVCRVHRATHSHSSSFSSSLPPFFLLLPPPLSLGLPYQARGLPRAHLRSILWSIVDPSYHLRPMLPSTVTSCLPRFDGGGACHRRAARCFRGRARRLTMAHGLRRRRWRDGLHRFRQAHQAQHRVIMHRRLLVSAVRCHGARMRRPLDRRFACFATHRRAPVFARRVGRASFGQRRGGGVRGGRAP
mmetsp:Transcript_15532/g.36129  ORF Transcript_15532/g.36129 Transcript_15532/m.36129 type:complete len:294 (-) Transcript_15532:1273-2154(-)